MAEDVVHERNIDAVLSSLTELWSPRTVAVVNDYDVRVVRAHGEFTRHSHPETDEFFLVLSGRLTMRMDEGDVVLDAGDCYVVPRAGRTNRPRTSRQRCSCSNRARRSIPAIRPAA